MQTDIFTPEPQASTLSGELSLLAPDPSRIFLPDIITALKHEVRYCGHTTEPVTVLQHSLCVFMLSYMDGASCEDMRHALWHDAPEAYLKDIPRPLKKLLGQPYAELEHRFEVAVGTAIGVDLTSPPALLRKWDTEALAIECELWRPKASYVDWRGLPELDDYAWYAGDRSQHVARRAAVEGIVWLDHLLSSENFDKLDNWLRGFGLPKRYGCRKGVAA